MNILRIKNVGKISFPLTPCLFQGVNYSLSQSKVRGTRKRYSTTLDEKGKQREPVDRKCPVSDEIEYNKTLYLNRGFFRIKGEIKKTKQRK